MASTDDRIRKDGIVQKLLRNPIVSVGSLPETARAFELLPSYPNPVSGNVRDVTIPFVLHRAADVSLKVYNSAGKVVETILENRLESGRHDADWNTTGYAPGLYFISLKSGGMHATSRVTVVR